VRFKCPVTFCRHDEGKRYSSLAFYAWRIGGKAPHIPNLGDDGWWSASRTAHFAPGTIWKGGWTDPTAGLDRTSNDEIFF